MDVLSIDTPRGHVDAINSSAKYVDKIDFYRHIIEVCLYRGEGFDDPPHVPCRARPPIEHRQNECQRLSAPLLAS